MATKTDQKVEARKNNENEVKAMNSKPVKLTRDQLAKRIEVRLRNKERKGVLQQARHTSSVSSVTAVHTPKHTDKAGKDIPEIFHAEFRAHNGKIFTIRSQRDYEGFLYMHENARAREAFLEIGHAVCSLNAPDVPEQAEDELADNGYGF